MTAPFIRVTGISKSFAGLRALHDVGFDVRPGEVHALLGENGAGKSTLIKIMAGVLAPDEGEITVEGTMVKFASPREAHRLGIATVHQELLLFPELTVAENIFLGQAPRTAWGGLDWPRMRDEAKALLASLDTHDLDVNARVGTLSVANRQRVEIARALSQNARLVIMDEPTAALAEADVRRLMDIVRRLRANGVAIVYVSHRMAEIFALADRVTVLRDGGYVGTRDIGEVDEGTLVSMMVGRVLDRLFPQKQGKTAGTVLELRNVSYRDVVRDISFELKAGEILGLAGLVGSGRTELALTIFGITPATTGEILLDGKAVAIGEPEKARELGIAYIPEDRATQGLIRTQTIAENVSLAMLKRLAPRYIIDRLRELTLAREAIQRFGIRAKGPEQIVRQLSGGNQQKVVLAKWLVTEPRILIMDEPTRGIDVGAKAEIHLLMRKLAGEGMAILMISSELPEVLGMSDRVLVMNGGRIAARFDRDQVTPEAVGAAMVRGRAGAEVALMSTAAATIDRGRPFPGLRRVFAAYGQEIVVLLALIVLFVVVGLVNPRFLSNTNLTSIFAGNAYVAVAAIGMSMVIISGHIDVSVGSLIGVLATIAGTLATNGYPVWIAWLVPILVGILINACQGLLIAYMRIPAIVVTLGFLSILKGGLISATGGAWITDMPEAFMIAQRRLFGIPSSVYFMVILTVIAALWMKYFALGRELYAAGGHPGSGARRGREP